MSVKFGFPLLQKFSTPIFPTRINVTENRPPAT